MACSFVALKRRLRSPNPYQTVIKPLRKNEKKYCMIVCVRLQTIIKPLKTFSTNTNDPKIMSMFIIWISTIRISNDHKRFDNGLQTDTNDHGIQILKNTS